MTAILYFDANHSSKHRHSKLSSEINKFNCRPKWEYYGSKDTISNPLTTRLECQKGRLNLKLHQKEA